jgi:hypothetical protein
MPHLPPTHHETSKHDSPNKPKIKKIKWNRPGFEFKPRQVNDSSQSNQGTYHLVSQSPPWWVHWQQKHKVWSSNPRPHEAQLEDKKKDKKSSRRSSRRKKTVKAYKRHEKRQSQSKWQRIAKKNWKEQETLKMHKSSKLTLPLKSTPPNTLNARSPLWIVIYHVSSLNHLISKEFYQLCAHTLPFWQWTHQIQTERRTRCYAWESKLGCFTRHTCMYLSNYIHHQAKTCKIRENPHKETITGWHASSHELR